MAQSVVHCREVYLTGAGVGQVPMVVSRAVGLCETQEGAECVEERRRQVSGVLHSWEPPNL